MQFTQDATDSRTVTLNSAFRINGKSFSVTGGQTTDITFIWDGMNWQA